MNINNTYATLYSVSQGHFHIETLDQTILTGLEMALKNDGNDYILIGIFKTHEEAHEHIKIVRAKQKALANRKNAA